MKKNKIISIFLSTMLIGSVVGCGSDTGSTTNSGDSSTTATSGTTENTNTTENTAEEITLRMAWWGSQTRHDGTIKVVEMYEEANPGINIEVEYYDFDGYFTKLNTLVASDTVWDIFQLGGNYPLYESKIVTLNDYVDTGVIDTTNTTEQFINTTSDTEGTLYGISIGTNAYGIAYDPAMFAEAGVSEPADNWTWDEWKDACLKIHETLGIYGSSKMDNFISGVTARIPQSELGANFFDPSGEKLGSDNHEVVSQHFATIKELTDAGAYPDPGAINEIKDIEGDYLVTGDAAMTWVASNQLNALSTAAGREIKIAPIPRITADGPHGMRVQSSQMLSVSQDSAYPEEAAKFIDYFVNNEEANKVLNGERGVPIMSNVRDAVEAQADTASQEIYNFIDKVGNFPDEGYNAISPAPKAEIEEHYKLLIDKVIYDELTPEEAANDFYEFSNSKFQ